MPQTKFSANSLNYNLIRHLLPTNRPWNVQVRGLKGRNCTKSELGSLAVTTFLHHHKVLTPFC